MVFVSILAFLMEGRLTLSVWFRFRVRVRVRDSSSAPALLALLVVVVYRLFEDYCLCTAGCNASIMHGSNFGNEGKERKAQR